jgi:DNA polymerase/3'-5' exonuclease PolX
MKIDDNEDWEMVAYRMKNEGFDYCWRHYSNFEEIKDEKFHKLRKAYISAAQKLEKYVDKKVTNEHR